MALFFVIERSFICHNSYIYMIFQTRLWVFSFAHFTEVIAYQKAEKIHAY